MRLESDLVYVDPCVVCGSKEYLNFLEITWQGPICSKDCKNKYLDRLSDEFLKKHFDYSHIAF